MEKGMGIMRNYLARVGAVPYHLLYHDLVEHG